MPPNKIDQAAIILSSSKPVKSSPSSILPIHGPINGSDKLISFTISITISAENPKNTNTQVMVPIGGLQLHKLLTFLNKNRRYQKIMLSVRSLDYA